MTDSATTATFTNMPYVRGCAFRIVVSATRFSIIELTLPAMFSMPAGYEEKDGLVDNGQLVVNNAVLEFFVESMQNMKFVLKATDDVDTSIARNAGILIQQVQLID
jgi:hypothetical protein